MPARPKTLYRSELKSLPLLQRGKVRDLYAVDDRHMLLVATDRLSAFDVILPDPVPGKGRVLTALSNFWCKRFADLIPNHLSGIDIAEVIADGAERALLQGRAVVVKRLQALPIEAVARGYLTGSGWRDYQAGGRVGGVSLPPGLRQAERLPEPIFSPATKAAVGEHDENIDFDETVNRLGEALARQVRRASLRLYREAAAYALARGIIIADTKFEFGLDEQGALILIDEVLTPDSSRFWPADSYRAGASPPGLDKQYIRDYLATLAWDKRPPGPRLPRAILENTAARYAEIRDRLMGKPAGHINGAD